MDARGTGGLDGWTARVFATAISSAIVIAGCGPGGRGAVGPGRVGEDIPSGGTGCPPGMAPIDGFCIDRWEAAVVELTAQGERPFSPYEPVKGRRVRAVSRPGMVPQAYISRNDANAACRAAGKRLCREAEWVRACMGATRSPYPYGAAEKKRVCNDSGVSPIARIFGPGAPGSYSEGPMNDPRLNQLPQTVAPGGAHKQCVTAEGVFDLVGNLHEWVDDPQGTFLGGYYLDTKLNGPGCRYKTTAHDAAYHDYSTGFRCCSNLGRRGSEKKR